MPHRPNHRALALLATGALATSLPALALADGIGPHSSFYSTAPKRSRKYQPNAVTVDLHRAKHLALVGISNHCLGTFQFPAAGPGTKPFTASKSVSFQVRERAGKLTFNGRGRLYAGQTTTRKFQRVRLSAVLSARLVRGTVTFPGSACHQIDFKAGLVARTR